LKFEDEDKVDKVKLWYDQDSVSFVQFNVAKGKFGVMGQDEK
jgi:hypothetical protein